MPTRLQHCGLIVADLERSRRFYGGALGLEEVPRPGNFVFEGAWFQVGDDQLHLLVETDTTSSAGGADPGPSASVGLANHVALEVDDLDARASGSTSTASRSSAARWRAATATTRSSCSIPTAM